MTEDVVRDGPSASTRPSVRIRAHETSDRAAQKLSEVSTSEEKSRLKTGIGELDRVLGGGIVLGSMVLLGGEPGAGKSTMLLQLCGSLKLEDDESILYITGEESIRQIKLRAARLGVREDAISVAAESDMDQIIKLIHDEKPSFIVVDSIQTMYSPALSSSPGSVSQVKECTGLLLSIAKNNEIPIFIVGHVNKDGAIAGPKVLEHIVDTVMYFEGDKTLPYRILRAVKNRYGSTNEIGMFDMTGSGLVPIDNPSEMLLEGRPVGVSGNCVGCIMEGTRPIMSEIQALATKSSFGVPRRATSGIDQSRANLLLAMLEKRAGFFLGNLDVYINVVGGLELDEPACDLAICLALVSSLLDKPLEEQIIAMGEVGLGGEIRSVANLETRLREAQRIGFKKAIIPLHNMKGLNMDEFQSLRVIGASYLKDAISSLL